MREPTEEEVMNIEANRFALCLLMPKDLVERYWAVSPDPVWMAQCFHVSVPAMTARLRGLQLVSGKPPKNC